MCTVPSSSKAFSRGRPSYWWKEGQERRLRLVLEHIDVQGKRLLDAGCGVGAYTRALQNAGASAFGIDIEADRVRDARQQTSGETLAVASAERLPCPSESVDVVFSHEVIEHLPDDRQGLAEVARVLRPGGLLVLFAPNRGYPLETHGILWRGNYRFGNFPFVNWLPRPLRERLVPHARAYTGADLHRMVEGARMEIRHHTQIFPGFDRIESQRPRFGRLLRQFTWFLERTPLRRLGISHFLVAAKVE